LVAEACGRLGISQGRDAFATATNHRFPAYWLICSPSRGTTPRPGPCGRTPSGGPRLSCWTLAQGHRPSSPCPLPLLWGSLTHRGQPGAWTRARNSWRPTATQIASLWGPGPGRRSVGWTCNASIQLGRPWAPPPPGPQPIPDPPPWAPPPRHAGRSSTRGSRRNPVRTPQRSQDLSLRVPPLGTPRWHRWQPT